MLEELTTAIKAALKADTALMAIVEGVHEGIVPPNADYPLVRFAALPSEPVNHLGLADVYDIVRFRFAAIEPGYDKTNLYAAEKRIVAVLQNRLSVSGYTTMGQILITEFPDADVDANGVVYQHVGCEWEFWLQATT